MKWNLTRLLLNKYVESKPYNSISIPCFLVGKYYFLAVAGCYTEGFRVSNAGGSVPQTSFFFMVK